MEGKGSCGLAQAPRTLITQSNLLLGVKENSSFPFDNGHGRVCLVRPLADGFWILT